MVKIKKIQNGEYMFQQLIELMDIDNPIILYHILNYIGSNRTEDTHLIQKVQWLGCKLDKKKQFIVYDL